MRTFLATLMVCAACAVAAPAQVAGSHEARGGSTERVFAAGGRVRMDLSAGGYILRGASQDGKIHVRWHADDLDDVRITLDVAGTEAHLKARGPRNNFEVEVDVPARTDLNVALSVGELDIQGIEGHKDLRCRVGDIKVGVGSYTDYRHAEASVKIGDIQGFGENHSGFFRSLTWDGPGHYDLHARLGVGDIHFFKDAQR